MPGGPPGMPGGPPGMPGGPPGMHGGPPGMLGGPPSMSEGPPGTGQPGMLGEPPGIPRGPYQQPPAMFGQQRAPPSGLVRGPAPGPPPGLPPAHLQSLAPPNSEPSNGTLLEKSAQEMSQDAPQYSLTFYANIRFAAQLIKLLQINSELKSIIDQAKREHNSGDHVVKHGLLCRKIDKTQTAQLLIVMPQDIYSHKRLIKAVIAHYPQLSLDDLICFFDSLFYNIGIEVIEDVYESSGVILNNDGSFYSNELAVKLDGKVSTAAKVGGSKWDQRTRNENSASVKTRVEDKTAAVGKTDLVSTGTVVTKVLKEKKDSVQETKSENVVLDDIVAGKMDEEPLGETEIRVKEESVEMPVSDPKDSINDLKPGEPITEEEVVQVINPHVKIESVKTVDAPSGEPKIKVEEECAEMPVSDLNAHLEEPEPIMPSVESGMIQDVKLENVVSDEIVADKKDEVLIGESEIGANEKVEMTVSDPKHSLGEQIQVKPSTVKEVAQDHAEIIESCETVAEKMDTPIGESKVAVEEKSPEMLVSDSKECLDGQNLDKGITQSAVQGESTKEDKTSLSDASEDVASADSETIQKTSQPLIRDSASGSSDPNTSIEDPDEQISVTESNTTEGLDNLDPQTEQITDAQKPKTTTDVPVELDNDGLSIAVSPETSLSTVCSSLIKETPKTLDATSDPVDPEVEGTDETCGNVEVPQLDEIADSSQPLSSEKSAVSDEMISHLDSRVNATLLEDVPELTSGAIPTAEVQNGSAAVLNKDPQESKESENVSSSLLSENLSPVSEKKSGNSKSLEQPIVEATKKDEVADDPRKEVSIDDEQPIESGESMDVSESTVPQLEVHKSGTMKETMEIVEESSGAGDANETEDREAVQTAQAPQEEISNLTEEPMGLTKSLEQPIDGAVHDDGGVAQKLLEGEDDLGKFQFAESSSKNVSEIASVESKPPIPTTELSQLGSPTSQVSILGIGSRLDDEDGNQESTDEITEKDDPLKSPKLKEKPIQTDTEMVDSECVSQSDVSQEESKDPQDSVEPVPQSKCVNSSTSESKKGSSSSDDGSNQTSHDNRSSSVFVDEPSCLQIESSMDVECVDLTHESAGMADETKRYQEPKLYYICEIRLISCIIDQLKEMQKEGNLPEFIQKIKSVAHRKDNDLFFLRNGLLCYRQNTQAFGGKVVLMQTTANYCQVVASLGNNLSQLKLPRFLSVIENAFKFVSPNDIKEYEKKIDFYLSSVEKCDKCFICHFKMVEFLVGEVKAMQESSPALSEKRKHLLKSNNVDPPYLIHRDLVCFFMTSFRVKICLPPDVEGQSNLIRLIHERYHLRSAENITQILVSAFHGFNSTLVVKVMSKCTICKQEKNELVGDDSPDLGALTSEMMDRIRMAQMGSTVFKSQIAQLESGTVRPGSRYCLLSNLLCKNFQIDDRKVLRIVLPPASVKVLIQSFHDDFHQLSKDDFKLLLGKFLIVDNDVVESIFAGCARCREAPWWDKQYGFAKAVDRMITKVSKIIESCKEMQQAHPPIQKILLELKKGEDPNGIHFVYNNILFAINLKQRKPRIRYPSSIITAKNLLALYHSEYHEVNIHVAVDKLRNFFDVNIPRRLGREVLNECKICNNKRFSQDEMSQQIASFYDTLKEDTDPADYSADVTVLPPGTEDTNLAGGESESPEKRKDSQEGIKKDGGVEAFEEAKPSDETSPQPDGLATVQGSSITQPADDSDSKAADAEEETLTGIVEVEKEVRLARQPDRSNLKLSSIAESETESQETLKRKNEEPAPSPKKLKQALDEVACDENIASTNDSAPRTASEDRAKEIVAAEAGSEPSDQSVASDEPTESGEGLQETENGLEKVGQNSQATVTGGPELDKVADVEPSKNDIRNEDKIGDTTCDSYQGNDDFDLSSRPGSVAEQAEEQEPATTSEDPEAVKSELASEDVDPQKLVSTESPEEQEPTTTAEDAEAVKSELASEDVDPQKLVTEESSAANIPEESSKLEVAPKTQEPPASEASEPKSSLAIVLLEKLCDEAVERSSNSNSSVCGDVALDDSAEDAADNPPESIASNALESVDSEDLQSPTQPKKRGRPSRLPKSPRSTRGRKKAATPSRSTRAQKSAIDETQDETGDAEDSTTGEFENSEQETVAPAEESSVPETEGRRSLRQRVVKNYSDQTEEPAEEHSDASDDVLENSEDEVETGVRRKRKVASTPRRNKKSKK
ncbi:unnamed protein product [Nesidiocoris tenuis]|uniref:Uncharacterized protein n=1 Tax=Nesidiocoris tenuis TaxID=355587 RepID=A0A6H5GJR7_9HEMI|nr:unnamed protein product [Nesidiocoris tenuis]